jgi:hypothetical protein
MNRNLTLSIPKPCGEQWEHFTPSSHDGFCSSCNKTVIDFTTMSDEQIFRFFSNNPTLTCGRFRNNQLTTYAIRNQAPINPGFALLKAGLLSLLFLIVSKQTQAQHSASQVQTEVAYNNDCHVNTPHSTTEHTVRGIVKEGSGEPLPGANVVLKGSALGTVTDADGRFEFPHKLKPGDVLVFSFIGFETEEYIVSNKADHNIEISLTLDMTTMGEVAVAGVYVDEPSALQKLWWKVKDLF